VRRARAARLREAGAKALAATLDAHVGTDEEIVVELPGSGRTAHYLLTRLDGALGALPQGTVINARAHARTADTLLVAA
jgi:threonylcarbamoyladenosine tRNA methylthiotransferase MtaB